MSTYIPETFETVEAEIPTVIALRNAGKSWDDIAAEVHWSGNKCRTIFTSWQMGAGKNKKEAPAKQAKEPVEVVVDFVAMEPAPAPARELVLSQREEDGEIVRITASHFYDLNYRDFFALAENRIEFESNSASLYQGRTFVLPGLEAARFRDFIMAHLPVDGSKEAK